jgi:hypothetical protein
VTPPREPRTRASGPHRLPDAGTLSTPGLTRRSLRSDLLELGPALVGATGGSGTRVVARIARSAGLFIGADLNESEDAIPFGAYSDRWIDRYLPFRSRPLSADLELAMGDDLDAVLSEHCAPLGDECVRWGWKEPRCMYLLPFLFDRLPALRFLHVVRDGRDMALSSNQNQLRRHADAAGIARDLPGPVRSIALWRWINLETATFGHARLGRRYCRIRFEDLCSHPAETASEILDFLALDGDPERAGALVASPPTLGRWRDADAALVSALEQEAGDGLRAFGYELQFSG